MTLARLNQSRKQLTTKGSLSDFSGENKVSLPQQRSWMLVVLESKVFTWIMTLLTVYALFGDDFRLLIFKKDVDNLFNSATVCSMLAFITEIVLSC